MSIFCKKKKIISAHHVMFNTFSPQQNINCSSHTHKYTHFIFHPPNNIPEKCQIAQFTTKQIGTTSDFNFPNQL